MLILEWIDLWWKTTFSLKIWEISKKTPLDNPYKPWEPNFNENTAKYYNDVLNWKFWFDVICDRLWISQVIYWKYKRNQEMPEKEILNYIKKSNDAKATFIFFLPSDEELTRRFNLRWDEYVTLKEIKELKLEYLKFLDKYWDKIHYNIISK